MFDFENEIVSFFIIIKHSYIICAHLYPTYILHSHIQTEKKSPSLRNELMWNM